MKNVSRSALWSRSASMMAVAACMVMPTIAQAQTDNVASTAAPTQDSGQGEEIVVTGIRASLERSIAIKRESPGIVDAISAEDIGKFPDTNLAESLQRVPGVSINRTNGEGSLVTVRGFGPAFNLVTLNGRQLASANISVVGGDQTSDQAQGTTRSFDFSNLATEGVRTLEVYKTGRAAVPSGGIGATINVVTRRPLDNGKPGLSGSLGAKAVYDTSVDGCLDCGSKVTPEFSGVLTWSDPEQRFGVNLFGSYQKRNFTSIAATSNDWNIIPYSTFLTGGFARSGGACTGAATPTCTVVKNAPSNPNQLVAIPNDSRYHYAEGSRERINGQATVQFKPTDTLTLTADALYAQNKQREERSDLSNWFNRPFDQVTFDSNPTVATATYLHESGLKDEGFEAQSRGQKSRIQDYGLNAKWEITPTFTLNLDGHISKATSRPDNPNGYSSTLMGMGANVVADHSVTYLSKIPQQDITITSAAPLNLNTVGSSIGRTRSSNQDQTVKEVRADFGWDLGSGSRFDFGGNYRKVETNQSYVEQQQTLGDWGLANPGDVQRQAPGALQAFCLICKFKQFNPGSDPDSQVAYRGNAAQIFPIMSSYYAGRGNALTVNSRQDNHVKEEIWAAYGQLTWKGEIGNAPARLVGGLRYEHTKSHTTSLTAIPAGIEWDSDNDFVVVLSNQSQYLSDGGSYDNILPQVDFQVEVQRNLLARISYSKTIARPNYNDLYTSVTVFGPPRPTINGGIPTANTGNARLRPLESDNFDASLEWYFKPDSYVSAAFFDKRVRNFLGNGQYNSTLFGLRDPTSAVAGSRSGVARAALQGIGADTSDENLYAMTSLLIAANGSTSTAVSQFSANYNTTTRQLDRAFLQTLNNGPRVQANGADALWNFQVTQPINNKDAEIYGVELAGEYFLGKTGFGVAAQYTLVRGTVGFNIGADPSENQFALVGLSDTASGTLIYDKNGISARLAYNWRGKSLSGVNRGNSRNPEYTAPFGQLDFNVSYDITPQIAVSFEGINLTKESVRTYARDEKQLWFAQELNRRFLLGARFKF
ncbi:TonB-dependent receptor [Sphingomonas azotifigens]|uniref:TonB-dependent receptor n=1 Tax=Sphingomonas azotifigens TaxID=330920 RepID=UPI000A006FAC